MSLVRGYQKTKEKKNRKKKKKRRRTKEKKKKQWNALPPTPLASRNLSQCPAGHPTICKQSRYRRYIPGHEARQN